MDLITSPTVASVGAPTSTVTRTPDSDTETPPPPLLPHPKRVHQNHHHAPPGTVVVVVVSYKECLKNHAASIGGHALDGCCEFMPGPTANPSDPTSLTCAACGCHRNFHRRDPDDPTPLHHHLPAARRPHSPPSASQLLLSLSGQSPSGPSDEIMNPTARIGGGQNGNIHTHSHSSKKRFRTKFSQEQKEKMYEFSEKIGWKLKRGEEKLVEEFCKQIGVGRGVFKVWMHNNKHSSSSLRREKELSHPHTHLHLHLQDQHHHSNGGSSNNGGNCAGVVHHEFYVNGAKEQETR